MLRLVNIELADALAFVDDPAAERPDDDGMLGEFLSLRRRVVVKLSAVEDYAGFASRYGALGSDCAVAPVPAGARAFMANLQGALEGLDDRSVRIESRPLWRFHVDAMRDIALLHAYLVLPGHRRKTTGIRLIQSNCIVYERPAGGRSCVYHGLNGLHPDGRWPRRVPGSVPSDVAAYLDAIGGGFEFSSPYRGKRDDVEGRVEWLESNAEAIIQAYLSSYLSCFPGEEGSLLAELQSRLASLVSQDRPLGFCVLCGGVAPEAVERYSLNFDGNACRSLMPRIRGELEKAFVEVGYSRSEASKMVDTSRKPVKARD